MESQDYGIVDPVRRAKVRLAIEDELDSGLPENYTREVFSAKCSALFEHVYESYYGEGAGVYN